MWANMHRAHLDMFVAGSFILVCGMFPFFCISVSNFLHLTKQIMNTTYKMYVEIFLMQYSRIRAAPLWVNYSQVSTLSHKDVKLSEPLNVVDGELDVSLNLQVPKVPAVHGNHASTQLGANKLPNILYYQSLIINK